eukprot:gene288-161_t
MRWRHAPGGEERPPVLLFSPYSTETEMKMKMKMNAAFSSYQSVLNAAPYRNPVCLSVYFFVSKLFFFCLAPPTGQVRVPAVKHHVTPLSLSAALQNWCAILYGGCDTGVYCLQDIVDWDAASDPKAGSPSIPAREQLCAVLPPPSRRINPYTGAIEYLAHRQPQSAGAPLSPADNHKNGDGNKRLSGPHPTGSHGDREGGPSEGVEEAEALNAVFDGRWQPRALLLPLCPDLIDEVDRMELEQLDQAIDAWGIQRSGGHAPSEAGPSLPHADADADAAIERLHGLTWCPPQSERDDAAADDDVVGGEDGASDRASSPILQPATDVVLLGSVYLTDPVSHTLNQPKGKGKRRQHGPPPTQRRRIAVEEGLTDPATLCAPSLELERTWRERFAHHLMYACSRCEECVPLQRGYAYTAPQPFDSSSSSGEGGAMLRKRSRAEAEAAALELAPEPFSHCVRILDVMPVRYSAAASIYARPFRIAGHEETVGRLRRASAALPYWGLGPGPSAGSSGSHSASVLTTTSAGAVSAASPLAIDTPWAEAGLLQELLREQRETMVVRCYMHRQLLVGPQDGVPPPPLFVAVEVGLEGEGPDGETGAWQLVAVPLTVFRSTYPQLLIDYLLQHSVVLAAFGACDEWPARVRVDSTPSTTNLHILSLSRPRGRDGGQDSIIKQKEEEDHPLYSCDVAACCATASAVQGLFFSMLKIIYAASCIIYLRPPSPLLVYLSTFLFVCLCGVSNFFHQDHSVAPWLRQVLVTSFSEFFKSFLLCHHAKHLSPSFTIPLCYSTTSHIHLYIYNKLIDRTLRATFQLIIWMRLLQNQHKKGGKVHIIIIITTTILTSISIEQIHQAAPTTAAAPLHNFTDFSFNFFFVFHCLPVVVAETPLFSIYPYCSLTYLSRSYCINNKERTPAINPLPYSSITCAMPQVHLRVRRDLAALEKISEQVVPHPCSLHAEGTPGAGLTRRPETTLAVPSSRGRERGADADVQHQKPTRQMRRRHRSREATEGELSRDPTTAAAREGEAAEEAVSSGSAAVTPQHQIRGEGEGEGVALCGARSASNQSEELPSTVSPASRGGRRRSWSPKTNRRLPPPPPTPRKRTVPRSISPLELPPSTATADRSSPPPPAAAGTNASNASGVPRECRQLLPEFDAIVSWAASVQPPQLPSRPHAPTNEESGRRSLAMHALQKMQRPSDHAIDQMRRPFPLLPPPPPPPPPSLLPGSNDATYDTRRAPPPPPPPPAAPGRTTEADALRPQDQQQEREVTREHRHTQRGAPQSTAAATSFYPSPRAPASPPRQPSTRADRHQPAHTAAAAAPPPPSLPVSPEILEAIHRFHQQKQQDTPAPKHRQPTGVRARAAQETDGPRGPQCAYNELSPITIPLPIPPLLATITTTTTITTRKNTERGAVTTITTTTQSPQAAQNKPQPSQKKMSLESAWTAAPFYPAAPALAQAGPVDSWGLQVPPPTQMHSYDRPGLQYWGPIDNSATFQGALAQGMLFGQPPALPTSISTRRSVWSAAGFSEQQLAWAMRYRMLEEACLSTAARGGLALARRPFPQSFSYCVAAVQAGPETDLPHDDAAARASARTTGLGSVLRLLSLLESELQSEQKLLQQAVRARPPGSSLAAGAGGRASWITSLQSLCNQFLLCAGALTLTSGAALLSKPLCRSEAAMAAPGEEAKQLRAAAATAFDDGVGQLRRCYTSSLAIIRRVDRWIAPSRASQAAGAPRPAPPLLQVLLLSLRLRCLWYLQLCAPWLTGETNAAAAAAAAAAARPISSRPPPSQNAERHESSKPQHAAGSTRRDKRRARTSQRRLCAAAAEASDPCAHPCDATALLEDTTACEAADDAAPSCALERACGGGAVPGQKVLQQVMAEAERRLHVTLGVEVHLTCSRLVDHLHLLRRATSGPHVGEAPVAAAQEEEEEVRGHTTGLSALDSPAMQAALRHVLLSVHLVFTWRCEQAASAATWTRSAHHDRHRPPVMAWVSEETRTADIRALETAVHLVLLCLRRPCCHEQADEPPPDAEGKRPTRDACGLAPPASIGSDLRHSGADVLVRRLTEAMEAYLSETIASHHRRDQSEKETKEPSAEDDAVRRIRHLSTIAPPPVAFPPRPPSVRERLEAADREARGTGFTPATCCRSLARAMESWSFTLSPACDWSLAAARLAYHGESSLTPLRLARSLAAARLAYHGAESEKGIAHAINGSRLTSLQCHCRLPPRPRAPPRPVDLPSLLPMSFYLLVPYGAAGHCFFFCLFVCFLPIGPTVFFVCLSCTFISVYIYIYIYLSIYIYIYIYIYLSSSSTMYCHYYYYSTDDCDRKYTPLPLPQSTTRTQVPYVSPAYLLLSLSPSLTPRHPNPTEKD